MSKKEKSPYFLDLKNTQKQTLIDFNGTGLRKIPAVYIIENESTGKMYVGSTGNAAARVHSHKTGLLSETHQNKKIRDSFRKTKDKGKWSVHIAPVETILDARAREQLILDEGTGCGVLLNISDSAYCGRNPEKETARLEKLRAFSQSKENRESVSIRSKNLWKNQEFRNKVIKGMGDSVTVNGVSYNSVREASRETGHCILTIRSRLENGKCETTDVKTPCKKVICEGVVFDSVNDAARHYGVAANTMTYRLQSDSETWSRFNYYVE